MPSSSGGDTYPTEAAERLPSRIELDAVFASGRDHDYTRVKHLVAKLVGFLKEKLDCALAAGWQWGGNGMGGSKAPGYLHLSFRGRGSAVQMLLTNLLPLENKS